MKKQVVCHDKDWNKFKVPAEKFLIRPSVYGVIVRGNKVLLSPQWDGYDFPGGGIKKGETIEEALIREVWEETGYNVKMGKLLDVFDTFFKAHFYNKYFQCILLYYICHIRSGKISTANFDKEERQYAKAAQWIDVKDVGKLKFYNSANSVKLIKEAAKIK